jgi:hypothetical protein
VKLAKDIVVGDNLYIEDTYQKNILIHTVLSIYQEINTDYIYIITSHKYLCFGKLDSNVLYSREYSKIYLEEFIITDKIIEDYIQRIEENKKSIKKIQTKYEEEIESLKYYTLRLEKELNLLKNNK